MRFLKILPIIAIAFLAACKSTVPQTESLLREGVSPAQGNSSSSAEMSLNSSTEDKIVKIEKEETAIFHEEIHGVTDDVLTEMCSSYKSDSVKKNVNCSSNAINYTIYYEYNGNDFSRDIVLTLFDDCGFAGAAVHYRCNYDAIKACKEIMNADYGNLE